MGIRGQTPKKYRYTEACCEMLVSVSNQLKIVLVSFPAKKSNTTLESETLQEEDNCKDNGVNPTQCSGLQSKSNERVAARPHIQPTTKDADANSSSAIPDGSFWKNLNQGKIKDARDYVKEQAPLADDMSKWTAHNMCEMYDDDLWELYKAAESSSDDCSPRSSWERKSIVCYSEASTQLHSSTTGKYTNDGRDSRSTRTADKIHGTGAKKKITKHRKKKKADSDESSDDSSNPTKESKQRKSPKKGKVKPCRRKENLEERKETSSKRFTSKLSAPIGAKEKKTQKSTTKLKGFLETPLGAKEQPRGRRHIKEEENLEFFRYIARNPGFFRSGTPLPPKEHIGEYNARSFMETTQREYAIDSVTAADNLFFFRTVSRSSHFYSSPSSRNAEFKGN
ncbi:hypothetical protein FSP39_005442 [Pinctada imbricata]|uniref:Uncharacterized protein n=1 Tax=Pinctada imbricata TaxID=66713 RepID=A0AA88Y2I0_PINIB|nr:hypothetical protein FSP39_005442 [Pinctada imbricata]